MHAVRGVLSVFAGEPACMCAWCLLASTSECQSVCSCCHKYACIHARVLEEAEASTSLPRVLGVPP